MNTDIEDALIPLHDGAMDNNESSKLGNEDIPSTTFEAEELATEEG